MPFNENSRLNSTQVQDRRGRSTGTRVAIGGGGIGLLILVVALLLGVDPGALLNSGVMAPSTSDTTTASDIGELETECQTGADANERLDCAIVGYVNSIQAFWTEQFATADLQYKPAQTVLFSGATEAACGYATGAIGPFYCQLDQSVYLDLAFFDELQSRFGAQGGPFAVAYVLSHEYGHHVQDLLGLLETNPGSRDKGPESMTVYTELQADCLSAVWVSNAVDTGYLLQVTDEEIAQALDTVTAVGDDRVQSQTQGYVSPESWTHGSSEQRQAAFVDGLRSGDPDTCETPGWTE